MLTSCLNTVFSWRSTEEEEFPGSCFPLLVQCFQVKCLDNMAVI